MKKSGLIFAMMLLILASCSKMERNEKKYIKGIMSDDFETSATANQEFIQWITTDKATMTHDFSLMREQLGLKVVSSADNLVRCYSWCVNANSSNPVYDNVIQWMAGDNFVAYSGPIDYLLAGRKSDIKRQSSLGHSIDTIFEITSGNHPVYLFAQSYINSDGKRRAYVSAAFLQGVRLMLLPFFFDGIEFAGNNEFVDQGNTPIGDLFKWDEKDNRFYAYQTDDDFHFIPGKYTVFVLGTERFNRLPDE